MDRLEYARVRRVAVGEIREVLAWIDLVADEVDCLDSILTDGSMRLTLTLAIALGILLKSISTTTLS